MILKEGDTVYLECYTSMGQSSTGYNIIEYVDYRFDPITGERFAVYMVNGIYYDSRDGSEYNNKKSMFYLDLNEEDEE